MQILSGGEKRDIISTLRDLLDRAEGGELHCVGIVWAQAHPDEADRTVFDNTWATDDGYDHSFVAIVTALEVMKFELIHNTFTDGE